MASMQPQRLGFASRSMSSFKFLESHEYIKLESDDVGIMGISDFAQSQLGDVVFVELPEVGDTVEKGEFLGSVESVKAASDVYAPLSGEILEVNEPLTEEPELVNKGAMSTAWFCKIKLSNPEELEELMNETDYQKHCEEEEAH